MGPQRTKSKKKQKPTTWASPGKESCFVAFLRSPFYPECNLLSSCVRYKDIYRGLGTCKVEKFTRGQDGSVLWRLLWLAHLQTARPSSCPISGVSDWSVSNDCPHLVFSLSCLEGPIDHSFVDLTTYQSWICRICSRAVRTEATAASLKSGLRVPPPASVSYPQTLHCWTP